MPLLSHESADIPVNISFSTRWADIRMISAMRLVLAATALLIIYIDPSEPSRHISATYATLISYTIYSAASFSLAIRRSRILPIQNMHWIDVTWFLILVALSGGTNSLFFHLLYFPILVASFAWGYASALRVTLFSALLFTVVGSLFVPSELEFELDRLLLRPIQLVLFGYLIARLGGFRANLQNRLQLLRDLAIFANPRFSIERTTREILERLRRFYDAGGCLLVLKLRTRKDKPYEVYKVTRGADVTGDTPPRLSKEDANPFLLPAPNHALLYRKKGSPPVVALDIKNGSPVENVTHADKQATLLDTESYLSVPVYAGTEQLGRLYIIGVPAWVDKSDVDFVVQLMGHVAPVLENMRLVDSLASEAADRERKRIARDIHDSVIQPYLGLQFGIAALRQKLEAGKTGILNDVKELLEMTNQELDEMRRYIYDLRVGEEQRGALLPAVRRYADRFSAITGIKVEVKANGEIQVNDRLAAELFQIVTEGLSNVRRHAAGADVCVEIGSVDGELKLEIRNRRRQANIHFGQTENGVFMPRSIIERSELLGGETEVIVDDPNYTVVKVAIPL